MNILGVNAFHADASACLIINGELIAAVEEERFNRIKHWAGFPSNSIKYCLTEAGLNLGQINIVAINQDARANLVNKIIYGAKNRPSLHLILDRLKNKKKRKNVKTLLSNLYPDQEFIGKIKYVEHHLAHLYSAFYVSPYEKAITVSVDGFGDFSSSAWGLGLFSGVTIDKKIHFPHSLGIFYQALTQYLGFPNYGDEYKVMGLAPYGEPKYLKEMEEIVLLQNDGGFKLNMNYFRHHKERIAFEWENGSPMFGNLFSEDMSELLGELPANNDDISQKHKDIAHSVQVMYEKAFINLLNSLHSQYNINNLALAGGCAMNSVANGKILSRTPFKKVYIQAAAGDAGGAIGAAYSAWNDMNKINPDNKKRHAMTHAYWGPSYSGDEIELLLKDNENELKSNGCHYMKIADEKELCEKTAIAIADGKVIGWFQGRMEWGPRALGNRSILGDPRRSDMKSILNKKIKRRESFRPFAPSILRDSVPEWFERDDDVPFMMKVLQIKKDKQSLIPAVTHVDGTGRLQTVSEKTNLKYFKLIKSFEEITGIPILLNTSFNENEPIVNTPEEALACFLRTSMDVLVMGDYLIER